jgi:hypothetical protein
MSALPLPPPPRLDWTGHWLSTSEYSRIVERPSRTVRHWCATGVLRDFNVPYFRDSDGRYWIKLTPGLFRP